MAPTTISLARVVELKVPIAWQEAVEVVHALEGASTAQATLITLEGALISIDGTVVLSPPGPGHEVWISPLRLLGWLLDGVTMPPELRELVGSEADALSSFPSEDDSGAPKMLTINWFTRPDGASLIGRLAARGIAASAAATGAAVPAPAVAASPVVASPVVAAPVVAAPVAASPAAASPAAASTVAASTVAASPVAASPVAPALVAASWPAGRFAPPSPAFVPKPRQYEWVPTASPLVTEAPALETSPAVPAITSIQPLRDAVSHLPAPVERVSVVVWLRENVPSDRTAVIAVACAATLLIVVMTWAWLATRPAVRVIAARGPVLIGSAVVSFAPPALEVSPSAFSASARQMAPAAPSVTTRPSRDREVVASFMPLPVSSLSAPGTRVAPSSNGYRSESTPVESAPMLSIASAPAAPPAPARLRPNTEVSAPPPAASVGRSARAAVPVDRRIYSDADEGVEPPTMVRLQMPSEPKPGDVGNSWVEVVVDERGQVAQVRLHSSKPSLNDRMIVSAAKAWQFQPALKDGHPVKYVLRLPIFY